ncbi:hypothetical protein [Lentzea sp. HUAS12]|uniref:hypothetical protein n=1 Tax=Lentzea sp. HUAS12 TaxID=2951806 RepID=UPI00209CB28B|nr:hypothetical protein [Lentzea sp. HUAS12]USX53779.1 hypothetical protein ND450_06650 [Lentzea sp. HUAS12]
MAHFSLDPALVRELEEGGLTPVDEQELAEQVARVLPFHAELPHTIAGDLLRVVKHVGGDRALLPWLDDHPGRPRLVARVYRVIGLLDELTARPDVVTALRSVRASDGDPPELAGLMPPATDESTLASLSWRIERLLGETRDEEAVRSAVAAVDLLGQVAPALQADVLRIRQDLV